MKKIMSRQSSQTNPGKNINMSLIWKHSPKTDTFGNVSVQCMGDIMNSPKGIGSIPWVYNPCSDNRSNYARFSMGILIIQNVSRPVRYAFCHGPIPHIRVVSRKNIK